jgi:hypothetical protein
MPKSVACLGPVDLDADKEVDSRSLPLAEAPVNRLINVRTGWVKEKRDVEVWVALTFL